MSELNLKTNMTELERLIANHDNYRMAVLFPDVVADLQTISARVTALEQQLSDGHGYAAFLHSCAASREPPESYEWYLSRVRGAQVEQQQNTPPPADLSDDEYMWGER